MSPERSGHDFADGLITPPVRRVRLLPGGSHMALAPHPQPSRLILFLYDPIQQFPGVLSLGIYL
jgi:hypothetical protein